MALPVRIVTDFDLPSEDFAEEHDDLAAAQGIALGVALSLPLWALAAWVAF